MSVNTNSNKYTTIFLISMVVLVALVLSLVATGLKPVILKNEEVDKKKKILKSVIYVDDNKEKEVFKPDFVLSEYDSRITEMVVNYQGERIEGVSAFDIDIRKEFRKPIDEREMPVFIYSDDTGEKYYIIPLAGMGLWDQISGYIALRENMTTIQGAAFDHKGETPGLGAEIAKGSFRAQFMNEHVFDEKGDYRFKILKGTGNIKANESVFQVDGISGATLTIQGVNDMMSSILTDYKNYFDKVKTGDYE